MGGIFAAVLRYGCAVDYVVKSLRLLSHRGHDGVGIVTVPRSGLYVSKHISDVETASNYVNLALTGTIGLGHVEHVTHGRPVLENAHPHLDYTGSIAVVQDGVLEYSRTI